jgi:hypothetical protein
MYLLHVEARLREEGQRGSACLDYSTRLPLIACVERQLIANHVSTLLDRGTAQRGAAVVSHGYGWRVCCVPPAGGLAGWLAVEWGAREVYRANGVPAPTSTPTPPPCRTGFGAMCSEPRLDSIALMFALFSRVGAVEPIKVWFTNFIVVRRSRFASGASSPVSRRPVNLYCLLCCRKPRHSCVFVHPFAAAAATTAAAVAAAFVATLGTATLGTIPASATTAVCVASPPA